MEATLLNDAPAANKKPEPVLLRSLHDYSLTETALTSRKEELTKLAKKNLDEGYSREARAVQADADAIEHHILPSFRAQRELPLVSHDQLEKEVTAAVARLIHTAFAGLGDPKVMHTPEGIASRKERLMASLGTRVTLYVTEVADNAFNQGVAAREQTAEVLAMRSIATLRASGD